MDKTGNADLPSCQVLLIFETNWTARMATADLEKSQSWLVEIQLSDHRTITGEMSEKQTAKVWEKI